MANKRKPTIMEIKNAINNMIGFMTEMDRNIKHMNNALSNYIDFKDDKKEWLKWLETKINKENLNGSNATESGDSSQGNKNNVSGKSRIEKGNQDTTAGK